MYGLGKPRTKLGAYLDRNDIKQNDIIYVTGIHRSVMNKICNKNENTVNPNKETRRRIIQALNDLGHKVKESEIF